jgi:hypothetical protein
MSGVQNNPAHLKLLEDWMRSYKPEELFDVNGSPVPEIRELAPAGIRRMGANPHANGGFLKRALRMPDFREYGIKFDKPGQIEAENTRPLGVACPLRKWTLCDKILPNLPSAKGEMLSPFCKEGRGETPVASKTPQMPVENEQAIRQIV